MPERRAIDLALELSRMPSLARVLRKQALPSDLLETIRIAAGCPESIEAVIESIQEPPQIIRAAAILYLQEILFFPGATPYRNLGVVDHAPRAQMRVHMRWLMQWLHPDHNSDEVAALLAVRVINAWRQLERTESPNKIDRGPNQNVDAQRRRNNVTRYARVRPRWIPMPLLSADAASRQRRKTVFIVLTIASALALILIRNGVPFARLSYLNSGTPSSSASNGSEASAGLFGLLNK